MIAHQGLILQRWVEAELTVVWAKPWGDLDNAVPAKVKKRKAIWVSIFTKFQVMN